MKHCPFMTIARSVAADKVVSHGACYGQDCALWNSRTEGCSFAALSASMDMLIAASMASAGVPPLENDKPPS